MDAQAPTWDPWILLTRLASHGLESVVISVHSGGELVPVTDLDLEAALAETLTERGRKPASLRAALAIVGIGPREARELAQRARSGEPWARRAYEAVVLRELVRYRIRARQLVRDLRAGHAGARAALAEIRRQALAPAPSLERQRARAIAYLLRDAMRAPAPEAPAPEAPAPEAPAPEAPAPEAPAASDGAPKTPAEAAN